MATYRIVELLDDENAATRVVDVLQEEVAESAFYAQWLGVDGNWYCKELPDIDF